MIPISLQIKSKLLIIAHKALHDLSPASCLSSSHTVYSPCLLHSSNTNHLSHLIFTQLRDFAHTLPLSGIPVPATHSPYIFVRLASSGHRLKVTFSPHLRRSFIFLSCSILCLHTPHALCSDFFIFMLTVCLPK